VFDDQTAIVNTTSALGTARAPAAARSTISPALVALSLALNYALPTAPVRRPTRSCTGPGALLVSAWCGGPLRSPRLRRALARARTGSRWRALSCSRSTRWRASGLLRQRSHRIVDGAFYLATLYLAIARPPLSSAFLTGLFRMPAFRRFAGIGTGDVR
jgi:hypothetical protein